MKACGFGIVFFFIGAEWILGRMTDVLFTQSEEDAALARRYGLCRGGTVEAIKNGVNPACFHPSGNEAERLAGRADTEVGEERAGDRDR